MYRHILKKHLRQKHGINAQRLDDRLVFFLYSIFIIASVQCYFEMNFFNYLLNFKNK